MTLSASIATVGARAQMYLAAFGEFCVFSARTFAGIPQGLTRKRSLRLLGPQLFEVGTLSIPVVVVTGLFVGMVLTVQTVEQFKAVGLVDRVGSVVNHSVLRELGPVLVGVLLAGRVGGGLTAELGTMKVTDQIDALRAMGCDPINVLVVPRFLACVTLLPLLVAYACFMGIVGSAFCSQYLYGLSATDVWAHTRHTVGYYDIFYGPVKSVFFGVVIGLISCFKGFRCSPGAAGVGRACTEGFVAICMAILVLDLFLGMLMNTIQRALWGFEGVL